jgi:hypothetical protein
MQSYQRETTDSLEWQSPLRTLALLANNVCSHKITTGFHAHPVSMTKMAIMAANPVPKVSYVPIAELTIKKQTIKDPVEQELLLLVSTHRSA